MLKNNCTIAVQDKAVLQWFHWNRSNFSDRHHVEWCVHYICFAKSYYKTSSI